MTDDRAPWKGKLTIMSGRWIWSPQRDCIAEASSADQARALVHRANMYEELVDLIATIENDDRKIPEWLWDRVQTVLSRARGDEG